MLASFLKSVGDEYNIEFRTDRESHLLIVKITRGFLYKETYISYGLLSDEQHIVRAIRNTVKLLEDAYSNG